MWHSISLYITVYHYISLKITVYHCISYISLYITVFLIFLRLLILLILLHITTYHYILINTYHYISLDITRLLIVFAGLILFMLLRLLIYITYITDISYTTDITSNTYIPTSCLLYQTTWTIMPLVDIIILAKSYSLLILSNHCIVPAISYLLYQTC